MQVLGVDSAIVYQGLVDEAIGKMGVFFARLEEVHPKPVLAPVHGSQGYRFRDQTPQALLLQKLAHAFSCLRAARILLGQGHVHEQGILHRVIDEANEDILVVTHAIITGRAPDWLDRFYRDFWKEEFDEGVDPVESEQKRDRVPRKKIQAELARIDNEAEQASGGAANPSRGAKLYRTVSQAYSGFVHGASPHIMELYGDRPPRFHISGMRGSPRIPEYSQDLWNYAYRTLQSHAFVAKALGVAELVSELMEYIGDFVRRSGKSYG